MKSSLISFFGFMLLLLSGAISEAQTLNISCDEALSNDLKEEKLLTPENCEKRLSLIRNSVIINKKGQPDVFGMTLAASIEDLGETPMVHQEFRSSRIQHFQDAFIEFNAAKPGTKIEEASFEAFHRGTTQLLAELTQAINTSLANGEITESSSLEIRRDLKRISKKFEILNREISKEHNQKLTLVGQDEFVVNQSIQRMAMNFFRQLDNLSSHISHKTNITISEMPPETSEINGKTSLSPKGKVETAKGLGAGRFQWAYGAANTANIALIFFQLATEYIEKQPSTKFNEYIENLPQSSSSSEDQNRRLRMALEGSSLPVALILNQELDSKYVCSPMTNNNEVWIEQLNRTLSNRINCFSRQESSLYKTELRSGRPNY